MKETIITFCLLISTIYTFAQRSLEEAYIILANKDTLKGKIDNKYWVKTPKSIYFVNSAGTSKEIDIEEIIEFKIKNQNRYVLKTVSFDKTPWVNEELSSNSERVIVTDTTILLEELIVGKINLYHTTDLKNKRHFYVSKDGELSELIDHYYLKLKDSKEYEVHVPLYKGQLKNLTLDSPILTNQKIDYDFTIKDMVKLVNAYNQSFGGSVNENKNMNETNIIHYTLKIGYNSYKYNAYSSASNSLVYAQKNGLSNISAGVGILIDIPSNRKKYAIGVDVYYAFYEELAKYNSSQYPPKNASLLGVSFLPQYSIYKNDQKQLSFFIQVGPSIELQLAKRKEYDYPTSDTYSSMIGYQAGVGLKINKFILGLNFAQNNTGWPESYYVSGATTKMGIAVGYFIK